MIKKVNAIEVKTIFLGESGVGKTSLIKAVIDEKFDANEKTTVHLLLLKNLLR